MQSKTAQDRIENAASTGTRLLPAQAPSASLCVVIAAADVVMLCANLAFAAAPATAVSCPSAGIAFDSSCGGTDYVQTISSAHWALMGQGTPCSIGSGDNRALVIGIELSNGFNSLTNVTVNGTSIFASCLGSGWNGDVGWTYLCYQSA